MQIASTPLIDKSSCDTSGRIYYSDWNKPVFLIISSGEGAWQTPNLSPKTTVHATQGHSNFLHNPFKVNMAPKKPYHPKKESCLPNNIFEEPYET